MRSNIDPQEIEQLMNVLGREARGSGSHVRTEIFSLKKLRDCFEAIAPELIRFPSLDPDVLRSRAEKFIEHFESKSEDSQE